LENKIYHWNFVATEGPSARINISQKGLRKATSGLWGTLDEFIVTGHDNGELVQWDIKVEKFVCFVIFFYFECVSFVGYG